MGFIQGCLPSEPFKGAALPSEPFKGAALPSEPSFWDKPRKCLGNAFKGAALPSEPSCLGRFLYYSSD